MHPQENTLYFEEYQQLNHPKQILFFTFQPFFPHIKKYFFHSITDWESKENNEVKAFFGLYDTIKNCNYYVDKVVKTYILTI